MTRRRPVDALRPDLLNRLYGLGYEPGTLTYERAVFALLLIQLFDDLTGAARLLQLAAWLAARLDCHRGDPT